MFQVIIFGVILVVIVIVYAIIDIAVLQRRNRWVNALIISSGVSYIAWAIWSMKRILG